MVHEIQKWLYDAHRASQSIKGFLVGKGFTDYIEDDLPSLIESISRYIEVEQNQAE